MNDIILSNKEVNHMTNSKKPSEPVEKERWALSEISTGRLVEELSGREGVETESSRFCRASSYGITIRLKLNKEECPPCLR